MQKPNGSLSKRVNGVSGAQEVLLGALPLQSKGMTAVHAAYLTRAKPCVVTATGFNMGRRYESPLSSLMGGGDCVFNRMFLV
jgi:hypothetical protein